MESHHNTQHIIWRYTHASEFHAKPIPLILLQMVLHSTNHNSNYELSAIAGAAFFNGQGTNVYTSIQTQPWRVNSIENVWNI